MGGDDLNPRADEPTVSMSPPRPRPQPIAEWGPFQLRERVGQGSFGEVYRAYDPVLEREVALKLLLPGRLQEGEEASALSEARALAKVKHPNVVPVYGVARYDDRAGFWSEYVHGKTLSTLLKVQGPFGPPEVAGIGIDLARALGAVHAAGLVHRDIKASNVMREAGGRILLLDFGLTQQREGHGPTSGTVPYIAPEILRGEPASPASDLYALGVLLYYLLAGKYPFRETTLATLRAAHESGVRPRLMDDRPDLSEPLTRVVETAMDPDPARRYASAGEMISALSSVAGLSAPAPSPRSKWTWAAAILVPAALAVAALTYFHRPPASAQQDYLQAQDLLDHYYRPHNIENAVALFRKTVAEDPKLAPAHAGLGRALWRQYLGTHDTAWIEPAKAASLQALALDREIASPHVTLAHIYMQSGRTDLAAEELQNALALNNRSADAYSALAALYQAEGRTADVEPTIQKALDLAPDAWPYLNQMGLYYSHTGRYSEAVRQFQHATAIDPTNPLAWNNLGLAYRRQNRLADAQAAYEKSLGIEEANGPLLNLGAILEYQGKDADAARIYRRAVNMNPTSYLSWANLASAQNRMPDGKVQARETYLKAISMAEAARATAPSDAAIVADLASFYAGVEMPAKSEPLLRQAGALAPDNPQVLYRVAEGYELLHRRADALHWIAKAFAAGLARETVDRNPELAGLRADPKFPAVFRK